MFLCVKIAHVQPVLHSNSDVTDGVTSYLQHQRSGILSVAMLVCHVSTWSSVVDFNQQHVSISVWYSIAHGCLVFHSTWLSGIPYNTLPYGIPYRLPMLFSQTLIDV